MRYERFGLVGVGLAVLMLAVGCSKGPTGPSGPGGGGGGTQTPTAVTVSGDLAISEGATSQLRATATLSDGASQDVTQQATWRSSNTSVATVSATGLLTSVAPGTADISATYGSLTGRGTAQVSVARYLVTITAQSLVALATCDDFTQGLNSGDFSVRVVATPTSGSSATILETTDYPGNVAGPRVYVLREDEVMSLNLARTFLVSGQSGQGVRVQFNATEWDQQIVVLPPSTRWIHDSRMEDRSTSRTHSFSNGTISGSGPNTLTLGDSGCGVRLNYTVAAVRQ